MMPRREFTLAGLSAGALAGLPITATAQERKSPGGAGPADHFETCAAACSDCQRTCDVCTTHCAELLAHGERHHLATLMACRDCADLCSAAAHIVARHGAFAALVCQSCGEACLRCAKECEQHGKDDPVMTRCAQECRVCEKACREMLAHPGAVIPR